MMNFSWIWPANFRPDLAQYTSASTLRMEMFWGRRAKVLFADGVFIGTFAWDRVWKDRGYL